MANKILGVEVDRNDISAYSLPSDLSNVSAPDRSNESGSLFTDIGAEMSKQVIEGGLKVGGGFIGAQAGQEARQIEAEYQKDFAAREEAKTQLAALPKNVIGSMVSTNDMSLTDTPAFTEEMSKVLVPFNKEIERLKGQINSGMRGVDFNSKLDASARKWIVRFPWAKDYIKESVDFVTGSALGGGSGGSGKGMDWQDKQDVEEAQKIEAKKYEKMSQDLESIGYPKGYFYENPTMGEFTWYTERDKVQQLSTLIAKGQAAQAQSHIVNLATSEVNLRRALTSEEKEKRENQQQIINNAARTQTTQMVSTLLTPRGLFEYENPLFDVNPPGLTGPPQKIPSLASMITGNMPSTTDPSKTRIQFLQDTGDKFMSGQLSEQEAVEWDLFLQDAKTAIPSLVARTFTARNKDGSVNEMALSIEGDTNDKIIKYVNDVVDAQRDKLWASTKANQEILKRAEERDVMVFNRNKRRVETKELQLKELKADQYLNYDPEVKALINLVGDLGTAGGQFLAMNQTKSMKTFDKAARQLQMWDYANGGYTSPEDLEKLAKANGGTGSVEDFHLANMNSYEQIFGQFGHEENDAAMLDPKAVKAFQGVGTSFVQFLNDVKTNGFKTKDGRIWTDGHLKFIDMMGNKNVQAGIDKASEAGILRMSEANEAFLNAMEASVGYLVSKAGENRKGIGPFTWHGGDIKIDLKSGIWVSEDGETLPPSEQERLNRIFPYNKMVSTMEWMLGHKPTDDEIARMDSVTGSIPGNLIYSGRAGEYRGKKVENKGAWRDPNKPETYYEMPGESQLPDKEARRARLDRISKRTNIPVNEPTSSPEVKKK